MCVTSKKDSSQGKLTLFSDKLQTIANFNQLPPINIENLRDIIQIDHYLYIIHRNEVIRIDLINEDEVRSEVFHEKINKAEENNGNLILWVEDQHSNHSILELTQEL